MSKKQLIALCLCNAVVFIAISSLMALMPVYLTHLGADSTVTGFFLAFAFLSLAISSIIGGWFSDRYQQRRNLLIATGMLAAPISFLLGQATTINLLLILMACLWFVTGAAMTMINALVGLFSEAGNRGRIFGALGLSIGLGVFTGCLVSGWVVDHFGYAAFFDLLAGVYLLIPIAGIVIQDKVVSQSSTRGPALGVRGILGNRTFFFLFAACVLAQAANVIIVLGKPLIMDALHFDATSITGSQAIGSLLTLPLPLVAGPLSDRFGRKPVLAFAFVTTALGLIILAGAVDLWQFWVASALQAVIAVSLVAGSALVTDLFSEESLGTSLALLNATPPIGIVIGFSLGGVAIRAFGMTPTLLLATVVSLVALGLLVPISVALPERRVEGGTSTGNASA